MNAEKVLVGWDVFPKLMFLQHWLDAPLPVDLADFKRNFMTNKVNN